MLRKLALSLVTALTLASQLAVAAPEMPKTEELARMSQMLGARAALTPRGARRHSLLLQKRRIDRVLADMAAGMPADERLMGRHLDRSRRLVR